MVCVLFSDIAELCHALNNLTNRQYRPGHQLVKLFNSLVKFAQTEEHFKSQEQVEELFGKLELQYKHSHPFIVAQLAAVHSLSLPKQKEKLARLAKQLDDHEQWETESRRKSKTRRKTAHTVSEKTNRESPSTSVSSRKHSASASIARTPELGASATSGADYGADFANASMSRPTSSGTLSSMCSGYSRGSDVVSPRMKAVGLEAFPHEFQGPEKTECLKTKETRHSPRGMHSFVKDDYYKMNDRERYEMFMRDEMRVRYQLEKENDEELMARMYSDRHFDYDRYGDYEHSKKCDYDAYSEYGNSNYESDHFSRYQKYHRSDPTYARADHMKRELTSAGKLYDDLGFLANDDITIWEKRTLSPYV